jgi:hypothetical protein
VPRHASNQQNENEDKEEEGLGEGRSGPSLSMMKMSRNDAVGHCPIRDCHQAGTSMVASPLAETLITFWCPGLKYLKPQSHPERSEGGKVGGTKSKDPVPMPLQLTATMNSARVSCWRAEPSN